MIGLLPLPLAVPVPVPLLESEAWALPDTFVGEAMFDGETSGPSGCDENVRVWRDRGVTVLSAAAACIGAGKGERVLTRDSGTHDGERR